MTLAHYISLSLHPSPKTAAVRLPLSKSIEARRLCLEHLSGAQVKGTSRQCDDINVLSKALAPPCADRLELHMSGTALRLLTAICAARPGRTTLLHGSPRLMERPMRPLLDALIRLGATFSTTDECLAVHGTRLKNPGIIEVDTAASSQFASALLLVGSLVERGLHLRLKGCVSRPYIDMTIKMMKLYGANVESRDTDFFVAEGTYHAPATPHYEADWSAASYFYEFAALSDTELIINGLQPPSASLQGDCKCASIFELLGVETDFTPEGTKIRGGGKAVRRLEIDMGDVPDLVPAVAATCVGLGVPFCIGGIGHLRGKESDRLATLSSELGKLGAEVSAHSDRLIYSGSSLLRSTTVTAHSDHRLAMALAPLSLLTPITLQQSDAVTKSFPDFYTQLFNISINTHK